MSSHKTQFLFLTLVAFLAAAIPAGTACGGIIILDDPNSQPLPVVINPAMHGIIFVAPLPKDNPGKTRRLIDRAHNWSAYKGRAPMVGGYYPYVYDPNDPMEIRTRAVVDYSLRRAQSYRDR